MYFEIKTIGEIFGDVKIGGTPARERTEYFGGGIPWVSIKDMGKGKYVSETNETLSESGVQNSNVKLIKKGSLLFSFKLTVGRMCFAGTDLYTNEAIAAFEPNPEIMLEYLYYILPVATKQVKRTNNFGAPLLNKDQIKKLQIPLPPLETQKAIVAKLDQIFAELDQTKSEIQKNLDNTDELWKSALNQAFQGDWEMKKIKDIADIKSGKRLPKGNFVQDKKTDYPYIRVSDFGDDGTITVSTVKYITEEIHEQIKKYIITDKDLYVSIAGTIGKTGIIPSEFNGANLTENAVRLVYNGKYEIDNRFILYFTNSKSFEVQAGLASRAVAMPKLAISRLENIELPVPPLSEQGKIVEHLDQVSKEVKALKSQYQSQLDNLEELKKSVLDKAFTGELVE